MVCLCSFILSGKHITDATFDVDAIFETSGFNEDRQIRFGTLETENIRQPLMVRLSWLSVLDEYDSKRTVKRKIFLNHKLIHKTPKWKIDAQRH